MTKKGHQNFWGMKWKFVTGFGRNKGLWYENLEKGSKSTTICGRWLKRKKVIRMFEGWDDNFQRIFGSKKLRRKYFGRNVQSWIFLKTCSASRFTAQIVINCSYIILYYCIDERMNKASSCFMDVINRGLLCSQHFHRRPYKILDSLNVDAYHSRCHVPISIHQTLNTEHYCTNRRLKSNAQIKCNRHQRV